MEMKRNRNKLFRPVETWEVFLVFALLGFLTGFIGFWGIMLIRYDLGIE